ncbi:hypothetical protein [Halegenticoccus soli]|nr:hypothetical protein [Halegenticoccus soli]
MTDIFEHLNPEMRHLDSYLESAEQVVGWDEQWMLPTSVIFDGWPAE